MSNKAKKRKVSMEPVLQDYTVTSFSDLRLSACPSDSTLMEEIVDYSVELNEVTCNQTDDINLLSGNYPSDSSEESFIKPQSGLKPETKTQRPFQKTSKKKSAEGSLFDSCLKDSFSDNSLEKVHKPFKKKHKSKTRLSIFDSDLESNTSTNDSPFKKPLQRKPKLRQQSNLFDSIIKNAESDTPNEKIHRPFQKKYQKKASSNDFDEVFTNDSLRQPSPVQNVLSKWTNRMKKSNESNLFDEVFSSSQSDVSLISHPFSSKCRTTTINSKNDTGAFDDLLNTTCNDSQNETNSIRDQSKIDNRLNEENTKSFSLEYNEKTGDSTNIEDIIKNDEINMFQSENEGLEINKENGKPDSVRSKSQNEDKTLEIEDEVRRFEIEEAAREFEENEKCSFDSSAQSTKTLQSVTQDEETLKLETDDEETSGSKKNEAAGELSLKSKSSDNQTFASGLSLPMDIIDTNGNAKMSVSQYSSPCKLHTDFAVEITTNSINKRVSVPPNISPNLNTDFGSIENEVTTNDTEIHPDLAIEITTNSTNKRVSVPQNISPNLNPDFGLTENEVITNDTGMNFSTPHESFKELPSSTPNVKGKRVSFLLGDVKYLRESTRNINGNKDISTKRKSSIRSTKENDSGTLNNLTKDNSMYLRKRRVSFKDSNGGDSIKQVNVKAKTDSKISKENKPINDCSSVSLESLVYVEPSTSRTPESESVYIDIHPSRCKSTSSSKTESFNNCKKNVNAEGSLPRTSSKSYVTHDISFAGDTETREYEETKKAERSSENTIKEEELSSEKEINTFSKTFETVEDEESQQEESDLEEELEDREQSGETEEESEDEEHLEDEEYNSEGEEDVSKEKYLEETEVSKEINRQNPTADHQENQIIRSPGEFKLPKKKKYRTSSIFEEKRFKIPNKAELSNILKEIPLSSLKKKRRRKSSEHGISKEQMQQYEIEEELMKNHEKKPQTMKTFSVSCKLKKPRKWVSPMLYDFLIDKLKPQYGIRSRVRAEDLVLFLVECVDKINKKKELIREDVEEMKVKLASVGIIKTHWDFFKFVDKFLDFNFKRKMFSFRPTAFDFGPTNVMENVL